MPHGKENIKNKSTSTLGPRRSSSTSTPRLEMSIFQGVVKFQILERLKELEESNNLLITLFRKSEDTRDYLKILLKVNRLKNMMYGLSENT